MKILLLGPFDILDEGHLIEEADEILGLIGIAWSTLGINEKFHEVLYSWVCFQQEWETLSSHQRQASSAIEVFRIIEEDQEWCPGILETCYYAGCTEMVLKMLD
ncbi:hypothetical protein SAY86_001355 [Trapa natans]|uniref:Uncharacterized protein n=1 Tax=Trapa natans TaxID=22666 RepID=A0AAN7MQX4_TRANT|nr:hypothetical protein SAY86_001355 [Trapa natans]